MWITFPEVSFVRNSSVWVSPSACQKVAIFCICEQNINEAIFSYPFHHFKASRQLKLLLIAIVAVKLGEGKKAEWFPFMLHFDV